MKNRENFPFEREFYDAHVSKINKPPEIMEKLCSWADKPRHILYFAGSVGAGKTYFSAAFYNYLIEKHPQEDNFFLNIRVFAERQLFSHLREYISNGWEWENEVQKICQTHFLILDDIGSNRLSDWQKDVLNSLIDIRWSNLKPTLITSNIFTHELQDVFSPRIKSRLCDKRNVIIDFNAQDERINREI